MRYPDYFCLKNEPVGHAKNELGVSKNFHRQVAQIKMEINQQVDF